MPQPECAPSPSQVASAARYPDLAKINHGDKRLISGYRLSRLAAAVSQKQLRENSALSNRDFDFTPAGACVSVKARLGDRPHGVARSGLLGTPGLVG